MRTERVELTASGGIAGAAVLDQKLVCVDGETNEVEVYDASGLKTAVKDAASLRDNPSQRIAVEPLGSSQVEEALTCVACAGDLVVVGDGGGGVRSWNLTGAESQVVCAGLDGAVNAVALSSTQDVIAVAYGDYGKVRIAFRGERSRSRDLTASSMRKVSDIALDPTGESGTMVLLDADATLFLWHLDLDDDDDLADDKEQKAMDLRNSSFHRSTPVFGLDWASTGDLLAVPGRSSLALLKRPTEKNITGTWDPRDFALPDETTTTTTTTSQQTKLQALFGEEDEDEDAMEVESASLIINCKFDGPGDRVVTLSSRTHTVVLWTVARKPLLTCRAAAKFDVAEDLAFAHFVGSSLLAVGAGDGRLGVAKLKKQVTFTTNPAMFIEHEAVVDDDAATTQNDDDDEDVVIHRKRPTSAGATPKPPAMDDDDDEDLEQGYDVDDEARMIESGAFNDKAMDSDDDDDIVLPVSRGPALMKAQPSFAPSATYEDETARFLHWSSRGAIVSRKVAEDEDGDDFVFVIETEHFADDETRARTLRFTSLKDHECATLGDRGAAFATKCDVEDDDDLDDDKDIEGNLCQLSYRSIGAWQATEWTMTLPPGERCVALAAGDDWLAALTNSCLCRLYSVGGVCDAVFSVPGHVVTATAKGRVLVVAYHGSATFAQKLTQEVFVAQYDVRTRKRLDDRCARVPLKPRTSLKWLGIAEDDDAVIAMDSNCVFYMLVDDFGWAWTPVLDAKRSWREQRKERRAKLLEAATADDDTAATNATFLASLYAQDDMTQWPVFVKGGAAYCATLKGNRKEPPPAPKPLLTPVAFEAVFASAAYDAPSREAEQSIAAPTALARHRQAQRKRCVHLLTDDEQLGLDGDTIFLGGRLPASPDEVEVDKTFLATLDAAVKEATTARDKALLRQLLSAVKADQLQFALDLAQRLSLPTSLDVALKIADAHGVTAFTTRVENILQARDLAISERDALLQQAPQVHYEQHHDEEIFPTGVAPPHHDDDDELEDDVPTTHEQQEEEDEDDEDEEPVVVVEAPPKKKIHPMFQRASNKDNITPKVVSATSDGDTGPVKNPFAVQSGDVPSSAKKRSALDCLTSLAFSPGGDRLKKRSVANAANPVNKLHRSR